MTEPTDAEKLAAAQAAVFAAQEAEKAARLPSAQAAADFLSGDTATAFLAELQALHDSNVDSLDRAGGVEGSKQTLYRIINAVQLGLTLTAGRVDVLQPTPAEETDETGAGDEPPSEPVEPAPIT